MTEDWGSIELSLCHHLSAGCHASQPRLGLGFERWGRPGSRRSPLQFLLGPRGAGIAAAGHGDQLAAPCAQLGFHIQIIRLGNGRFFGHWILSMAAPPDHDGSRCDSSKQDEQAIHDVSLVWVYLNPFSFLSRSIWQGSRELICILLSLNALQAVEKVVLQSPLSTVVMATAVPAGEKRVLADIVIPADAPADLGVAAFVRDAHGRWFQRNWPGPLTPGRHRVDLSFTAQDRPQSEPTMVAWRAEDAERCRQAGLVFWSATTARSVVEVERLRVLSHSTTPPPSRLTSLAIEGLTPDGMAEVPCGQRWTVRFVPTPLPENPADETALSVDARISGPDGDRTIPCAYVQPMRLSDGGDREVAEPVGAGRFELRFRPSQPGLYQVMLMARWGSGAELRCPLPSLRATGPACDTLVRVDQRDPRFFSVADRMWWPIGLNLHSTFDRRSADVIGTRLTPARGTLVYEPMLRRCAAAGIDATEIWLSAWNLALEWNGDWPGFGGVGRINQANAARLDAVLDAAWAQGIRVNLVINNHGQASPKADREWKDNPWNQANGGPLASPEELFTDPRALAGQQRIRRYLVARYADHPAILGWKLWSEVDLTAGRGKPLVDWFRQAGAAWRALDSYGHVCTPHWSGTFARADPAICALPELGYLCIDAYRGGGRGGGTNWMSMAELLADSIHDRARGLSRWGKPVLTTEYGVSGRGPLEMRVVDHDIAGWASMVSGHAGAAMTWWWEWVDQNERWHPYRSLRRFLDGEDLRGADARSVFLAAASGDTALWCRAWSRPGHLLGYVVDPRWATTASAPPSIADLVVTVSMEVEAGSMRLTWWDPDRGVECSSQNLVHPGGPLRLQAPSWSKHLAFKLTRQTQESDQPATTVP